MIRRAGAEGRGICFRLMPSRFLAQPALACIDRRFGMTSDVASFPNMSFQKASGDFRDLRPPSALGVFRPLETDVLP